MSFGTSSFGELAYGEDVAPAASASGFFGGWYYSMAGAPMFKNVASQKIQVFAFDTTTGTPKTGDAANITAYVSKDYGSVTVLGDTSATEMDATNAKGMYLFDLTQGETNADSLLFTGKSATANIVIVPVPLATVPPNFTLASIDSNGRLDVIKVAGTTQTARDLGDSVLLSSGTGTGQLSLSSGLVTLAGVTHTGAVIPTVTTTTTATNLTNAATSGDLTATMKTSVTTAASSATPALSAAGVTAIWAEVMTGSTTAVQAMRGFLAVLLGKGSGLATTTAVYRDVADTKDVVTATVDSSGNRTAITRDLT